MTYTKDHINWIDRLKGIAILLVVMGHVYCKCLKNEDALGFFLIQGFHMPLFMFLSGIVIKGYPSFKKCIVKSIQFLSPALIVGCVLCVITNRTMIGMLTSGSKYGYWYLYVLVIFYWLLFVYGRIGRKWSGGGALIVLSILTYLLLRILYHYLSKNIIDCTCLDFVVTNLPWFMFGVWIRQNANVLIQRIGNKDIIYSSSLMCIVVYYLLLYLAPNLWIREIFALLMIVALVAAFVTRESDKSSVEIILSKVGNKSLDIYIYHYILISMIHIETLGKWFVSSANPFIELMLVFMLSTIISAISIGIGIVVRKGVLLSNVIYGKWIK